LRGALQRFARRRLRDGSARWFLRAFLIDRHVRGFEETADEVRFIFHRRL